MTQLRDRCIAFIIGLLSLKLSTLCLALVFPNSLLRSPQELLKDNPHLLEEEKGIGDGIMELLRDDITMDGTTMK